VSDPVAWWNKDESSLSFKKLRGDWQPLYTAPPKKEWVDLTDEEIAEVFGDYMDSLDNGEEDDNWGYERLLEAAIKEKNT
jgi:hypothetical protein